MKNWFVGIKYIDWTKMLTVVGVVAILWGGIAAFIPAKYHTPIMVLLGSIQAAITFALRGGKYVDPREETPSPDED